MLSAKILLQFQKIFSELPEIEQVFLYGSQARGQTHAHSDIDLALVAPQMSAAAFARLQYMLTYEMPTLTPIEIARLDGAAPDFIQRIQQKGVVIYAKSSQKSTHENLMAGGTD